MAFKSSIVGTLLLILASQAQAVLITYGSLTTNNDGSTNIINDSLNNYEWLRLDVLASADYRQTLDALGTQDGGGWIIADHNAANDFMSALFNGTQSCTMTINSSQTCGTLLGWRDGDLGDNWIPQSQWYDYALFISSTSGRAGLIDFRGESSPNTGEVILSPDFIDAASTDRYSASGLDYHISWLLYRNINPIPSSLVERLGGLAYYDTESDLTWLADANDAAGSVFDDGISGLDGRMTWQNANDWVDSLNIGGVTGWRLPYTIDVGNDGLTYTNPYEGVDAFYNFSAHSEMSNMYYNVLGNIAGYDTNGVEADCFGVTPHCLINTAPFSNLQPNSYWSSTEYVPDTSFAWNFTMHVGGQDKSAKINSAHAWAVHDGDVLIDTDNDGVIDNTDVFPANNAASVDNDNDGLPDMWNASCDILCQSSSGLILDPSLDDTDNDGVTNGNDAFPNDPTETLDSDSDGIGDNADVFPNDPTETLDKDGDGIGDNVDNCLVNPNADQLNTDADYAGNVCDVDDDNDGVLDTDDAFPLDPTRSVVTPEIVNESKSGGGGGSVSLLSLCLFSLIGFARRKS